MNPVVHFEIPAKDYERAKKFYIDLFGWDITEWPGNPIKYGMATTTPTDKNGPKNPGEINGAIMEKGSGVNATVVTIKVPSIDKYLKMILKSGGKLKMPKTKIGDMGHNASFFDTEGNVVGLWEDMK